jgi:hypothetical protein
MIWLPYLLKSKITHDLASNSSYIRIRVFLWVAGQETKREEREGELNHT